MRRRGINLCVQAFSIWLLFLIGACADAQPWLTNAPIVDVQKQIYIQHTQAGVGKLAQQFNSGPGLQRIEDSADESEDDARTNNRVRFSNDNGQTWSAYQSLPNDIVMYGSTKVWEGQDHAIPIYDSRAGVLVQQWLRQVQSSNGKFYNFSYYRMSADHGHTWSTPKQLKYEAGPDFIPSDPENSTFLNSNNAYFGQNLTLTSGGKLIYGAGGAKSPTGGPSPGGELFAALNFVGTWNGLTGTAADYTWQASNRIAISSTYINATVPVSTRGLQEATTAQLQDGRVIDAWRGSNSGLSGSAARSAGGHKWFGVANSDGMSLSPVQELKYDDGTQFFSPSSLSRLFRSEHTGKLYWFGNIVPSTPSGNSPRYPLVIAEFDENLLALKKSTVTVIADKAATDPSGIQFSNFSLLENRETHQIEMYLTNYGIDGPLGGDCYKYTLTFKKPGDYNADGRVDAADYVVWRNTLNQQIALPNEMATLGSVTPEDYQVWRAALGSAQSQAAAAIAVPEPQTWALGILSACSWIVLRWHW